MAANANTLRRLTKSKAGSVLPSAYPSAVPAESGGYYQRIEAFAKRIRATPSVEQIISILDEALSETRSLHKTGALAAAEDKILRAEQEIEALKAELTKAIELTNTDPLTALFNRRGLTSGFAAEAARSDRHGSPFCVALIDIDNFKQINDSYGHPTGDAVLAQFAKVMRSTLRPSDLLARIGGEEFKVLLPDTNEQAAFAALNRLLKAIADNVVVCAGQRIPVTFTGSIAMRTFGETQERLTKRLDDALYVGKRSGKNRIMIATAG